MIVLTGATGFLGAYMARSALAAGHRVRAIRRENSSLALLGEDHARIEWVDSDLFDPTGLAEAMDGADAVVHAAAIVSFAPGDREHMIAANADGTANVVNAALSTGVKRMLHISSVAAVGRKPEHVGTDALINETWPYEQNSLGTDYALSKHLAEREAWRGQAEGLDVLVVNPTMILGAGFWDRGTARFFQRVDEGLTFYTNGGTGIVDVRDVADACWSLLAKEAFGERFILVGENARYRDLFTQIAGQLDRPAPSRKAGPGLLRWVARWEMLKARLGGGKPDLTPQTSRVLQHDYRYDNSKVRETTGMVFRPLAETIRDTAAVYRQTAAKGYGLLDW